MNDFLDLIGASGRHYRYTAAAGQLSPAGGNFAIVRLGKGASWEVLRLGETHSLAAGAIQARTEAVAEHGSAVRLFVRLNISRKIRDEELIDLLAVPMSELTQPKVAKAPKAEESDAESTVR